MEDEEVRGRVERESRQNGPLELLCKFQAMPHVLGVAGIQ